MKALKNNIWRGICGIVIGLIMVLLPDLTLKYLVIVIGMMLLVFGGISLGIYINARKNRFFQRVPITGILSIILGLMLVIVPKFFLSIIMLILGILLILTGIIQISDLFILRKRKVKLSWIFYLFPIISLAGGIVVVLNPFASIESLMAFFGIASILSGCVDIVDIIAVRSAEKEVKNIELSAEE